ncbi:histidine kinase,HAMP domain-containing protein,histidine kinase [Belliella baltica DSM 15883]|uniref:histidine kinase n=1 Tax=Belliella baltica (strain DSM 15883 / CIP 108006 / LMG 21964 / BA134) TaxID=866536 RepID=I3ZAJ6_BELBD|nr:ATP-binding protein [Belliella baltica]AFL86264.1 histidine kinase,HAMP domain-containing protein,histidine kinase [Belliella baltica DSM 15883]
MLKKRRLILLVAVLGIGALLALNYFLVQRSQYDRILEPIERKIHDVEAKFDQDFIEILMQNRPDEKLSFSNLLVNGNYPYYLFDSAGNLAFWSDFTNMPDFDLLNQKKQHQYYEDKKGIFYLRLRSIKRFDETYWLVQLYPLNYKREVQNDFLISGFNPELFGNSRVILSKQSKGGNSNINSKNGEFIFSIEFESGYESVNKERNVTLLVFFFSLLILVLIVGYDFVLTIWKRGKPYLAILYAAGILFSIRGFMLFFNFPQNFFDFPLFDSSKYASSWFNPSLGDLLLNTICSLIIFSLLLGILASKGFQNKFNLLRSNFKEGTFILLAYLLSTILLALFYGLYINILSNSQWDLNILSLPSFDYFKMISLLIVFFGGTMYLLFSILGINLVLSSEKIERSQALRVLVYFSVPLGLALAYFNWVYLIAFLAHFILLVSIVSFELYKNVFKLGFNTFLTFFFGCLIGAVITGIASHQVYLERQLQAKERFGTQQLIENDVMAEFYLAGIMDRIKSDLFIKNTLIDPFQSNEAIDRKIRKIHLTNYFDQYDIDLKIFNAAGDNVLDRMDDVKLQDLRLKYIKSDFATTIRDLYFIKGVQEGVGNRYISFIPLLRDGALIGTAYLELRQLKILPGSVFPKLLMDRKYNVNLNDRNYDYALFIDRELQYSVGVFNYRTMDLEAFQKQSKLYSIGIYEKKYHHLGIESEDKLVVVSSPVYPIYYILADISLFFVAFIILTLISVLIFTIVQGLTRFKFNYATKLQMYLNFAFFFPILTISLIIIGLLTNSYREELHRQYFQKASLVGDNLSAVLERQAIGEADKDDFAEMVNNLAGTTNVEINVFDPEGMLIATSQPNTFDKGILTKYINPRAIVEIIEGQNNRALLEEKIGSLGYKSVYLAIRSSNSQQIRAILAIPFFESESELDLLIADVLSNIANIFVLIFIIFLFVSYFVSKNLTFPFNLLTQKLKNTDLDSNEPMYWPSNDEIGLLVNEYNNMLFKLEASKKILSNTEKESAWREMAKQVAHEIKNPLTPMKLTLQHLLRLQAMGNLEDPEKLKKPLETLIHQIDTLSDIATSFSTFAKMPLPKNIQMDFRKVVLDTIELFKSREKGIVTFEDLVPDRQLTVMGDDQLFGRVISNLIINGIQAVESKKKAQIKVFLNIENHKVILKIKDNGKGISDELKDKIFIPNFSTKSEGSGLGLAIAKRGVETAGGKIWFDTEKGKGSTFYLAFDLVE